MASVGYPYLVEADAATHQILKRIGPVTGGPGVRPFTVNGAETLAFMTVAGVIGFHQVTMSSGRDLSEISELADSADDLSPDNRNGLLDLLSHGLEVSRNN